jgi:hypothetical protein
MQKSTFKPWVGKKYYNQGLYGIKILFLGESHYGTKGKEKADTTINVVKRLGLCEERCHRFFTITAKFALLKGSKERISRKERREFWEQVAFYNYIQEFVANGARKRPTKEMWESSREALLDVVKHLEPQLIIVLGKELNKNLPPLPENIHICKVNHPSSGFKYSQWIPVLMEALKSLGVHH